MFRQRRRRDVLLLAGMGSAVPVIDWCYTFYNHQRRLSAADGLSPVNCEIREHRPKPEAA
jgi:hypothetical protein